MTGPTSVMEVADVGGGASAGSATVVGSVVHVLLAQCEGIQVAGNGKDDLNLRAVLGDNEVAYWFEGRGLVKL